MKAVSTEGTNKNIVLVIATVGNFIVPFLTSSVNVALPKMGSELHMNAVEMSWVSNIYLLALAMVMVPMGRLADIYGRKKLFIAGVVIFILASTLGALANSPVVLLISRVGQGIGAGITFNTSIAILTSVYPPAGRGKALGIAMAGTYGGLIFGPVIGGFLTERFDWPSIFILSACLNFILLLLVLRTLKGEWREARGEKFDVIGSMVYGVAIAMFIYGLSVLLTPYGIVFFLAGVVGLIYFIRRELKAASPILDLSMFKNNRVFLFSNLATLINYLATYAVTFLMSLYLQYIKVLTAEQAGLILIASSIPMAVLTPVAGRLSDRTEPRLIAAVGQGVSCLALGMMIFLGNDTPIWFVIIALVLWGTGIGFFSSPNTNAIMGSVEKRMLGVASGTIGTMRTGGMMLSMGIMMILFSVYLGHAEITPVNYPQFLTSVRVGFFIFSALGIGGIWAQLASRKKA